MDLFNLQQLQASLLVSAQHQGNSLCKGRCVNYYCKARDFSKASSWAPLTPPHLPPAEPQVASDFPSVLSLPVLSVYSTCRTNRAQNNISVLLQLSTLSDLLDIFPVSRAVIPAHPPLPAPASPPVLGRDTSLYFQNSPHCWHNLCP